MAVSENVLIAGFARRVAVAREAFTQGDHEKAKEAIEGADEILSQFELVAFESHEMEVRKLENEANSAILAEDRQLES